MCLDVVLDFPHTGLAVRMWLLLVLVTVMSRCTTTTKNHASAVTANRDETQANAAGASRRAMAELMEHIQNLSVVKQKAPPVTDAKDGDPKVAVDVLVMLASVISVDDAEQTMTSAIHFYCSWRDMALQWNASDFSGVRTIEVALGSIWTPHLFIMNSDVHRNIIQHANHLEVHSDGGVKAQIPFTAQTLCSMNLEKFPYDTQRCSLIVDTISRQAAINLTFMLMDPSVSEIMAHKSDWELVRMSYKGVYYYGQDAELIPSVEIELRRRTTFYTVILVLPMVLTSIMNTLVFLVPLQSGEKISFLVTIFVSTSVFITFFKDVMPRGLDSVPATMKLLIGVIVQSLVVLVATLFVMWRFHAEQATADVAPSTSSSRSDGKMIVREDVMGDAEEARPAGNKEANLLGGDGEGGITQVVKKVAAMTESSKEQGPEMGGTTSLPEPERRYHVQVVKKVAAVIETAKEQGPEMGGTTSLPERRYHLTAQCLDRIFFFFATVANTIFLLLVFFE